MAFEMERQNYRYTAAPNPNDGVNAWVRDSLLEVTVILSALLDFDDDWAVGPLKLTYKAYTLQLQHAEKGRLTGKIGGFRVRLHGASRQKGPEM